MADAPPDLQIRLLRPGDDPDAQLDLSERAFGPGSAADRDRRVRSLSRLIAAGRYLGAFVGGRPAAGAAIQDMRQWWLGRPVPMAGVSSVTVAPEYRGRGIGRMLMTALLDEIAAQGYPLSALFPATMPLYRSLGWELAGARDTVVIPARSLLRLVPPDARPPEAGTVPATGLRRAGPGDAEAVDRGARPGARGRPRLRPDHLGHGLRGRLAGRSGPVRVPRRGRLPRLPVAAAGTRDLYAERAEAISAQTARALWTQLGSHASIAEKVYARTGPASAFWWLTRERDADIAHRSRWMLRVVDAPAAIAARGFPAATSLTVPLRIADEARPANSGRWRLTVAGGAGTLDPLGPDASAGTAACRQRRHAGRARAGRAVRRNPSRHAAAGGPGRRRDGGRRRRAGRRLRRYPLHARRLLTDTPPALRPAPPAGR